MNQTIKVKIYWVLFFLTIITTGMLSGFITSHSVMLGRFFTWCVENNHTEVFSSYFAQFRIETRANVHYNLILWINMIIGILWTITCFINKRSRIVAVIAGISTFWVGSVFFASNFAEMEGAVCSGISDANIQQSFVSLNIPLHISFAVFYTLCFVILLYSAIRERAKDAAVTMN